MLGRVALRRSGPVGQFLGEVVEERETDSVLVGLAFFVFKRAAELGGFYCC